MAATDIVIVVVYVLALFLFGVSMGIRETSEDFLVLSRRANLVMILFSVVSSWVGVGVIVGTAAAGYDSGISFALTGALGAVVAVTSVALFAPTIKAFGDRYSAHTIGDFFGVRYSRAARAITAAIVILVYMLLTAVQFTGLSVLLRVWTGLDISGLVTLVAITTVVYTAFAGIKSDFYTDAVHFVVMALVLVTIVFPAIYTQTHGLRDLLLLPKSHFDPFAFGGVGYFFGGLVFGVGVVMVSMELWQRIYAAANASAAKRALIGAAFSIIPFYLVAAVGGMAVRLSHPGLGDRDLALFILMKDLLPRGVLGLGVAAFIAVFISSANTMLMVVSATLTKDVYATFIDSKASERNLLRFGRLSTLIAGLGGWGLSYAIHDIITLSITALFLLLIFLPAIIGGFFWPRSTNSAAIASVVTGFVATVIGLRFLPTTAFVPAFMLSVVVFVAVSFRSDHGREETLIITTDREAR